MEKIKQKVEIIKQLASSLDDIIKEQEKRNKKDCNEKVNIILKDMYSTINQYKVRFTNKEFSNNEWANFDDYVYELQDVLMRTFKRLTIVKEVALKQEGKANLIEEDLIDIF